MNHNGESREHLPSGLPAALLVVLAATFAWSSNALAQVDICGCANDASSRGTFDSSDETTFASAGAVWNGGTLIEISIPPDGRLIFDSFVVDRTPSTHGAAVRFIPPAGVNPPVTLLVEGEVTVGSNATIDLNGVNGSNVDNSGGLGGPGGFRGGDSALPEVNFATHGGAGFGPGGGLPGTGGDPDQGIDPGDGQGGTFIGIDQLTPLLGGGGGGGGGASDVEGTNCRGGTGGGGGGAILIASSVGIRVDGVIRAHGGLSFSRGTSACSGKGGHGSGGAVRLIAPVISSDSTSTNRITALGGTDGRGVASGEGQVRLEAFNTNGFGLSQSNPRAKRAPAPGPIENPYRPTVNIVSVDQSFVPDPPTGGVGAIDVSLTVPGTVPIELSTQDVPADTLVDLVVKPRVGGDPVSYAVPLANCTGNTCTETEIVDLAPGQYVIEAEATFQPVP